MKDTAIVFLAHVWNGAVARRFERLRRESAPHADCFVLLHDDGGEVTARWKEWLASIGAADALVPFVPDELPAQLGFRFFGVQRILSNAHFPLMLFARTRPYRWFWQVECDVEYRGSWADFFPAYEPSQASLIAAHFHSWPDWPEWFWWPSLTPPFGVTLPWRELYKAFLPVMRLSRAAIECVEQAHRDGWCGHAEALVPTVLLRAGHHLEDLNVRSTAYQGWSQDPVPLLPLQSTVRCRPVVGLDEFRARGQGPLLFHPVKEHWTYDGGQVAYWPPQG